MKLTKSKLNKIPNNPSSEFEIKLWVGDEGLWSSYIVTPRDIALMQVQSLSDLESYISKNFDYSSLFQDTRMHDLYTKNPNEYGYLEIACDSGDNVGLQDFLESALDIIDSLIND